MHKILSIYFLSLLLLICSCKQEDEFQPKAEKFTRNITFNNVSVDVIIDKPAKAEMDVLIVYHGTVVFDDKIMEAAENVLTVFNGILKRSDMMIVSVAYPEENLLLGDNIAQSEAALLWIKNKADDELGIKVKKIFLAGHSQGGYLVTRLNTMHQTNGVIANAPGPLNLVYRCQLEENGTIPKGIHCNLLNENYGSTAANPDGYFQRSLLNFTTGHKADILFVQGLMDSNIQMYSWPVFKEAMINCDDCQETQFFDVPNFGHSALFKSTQAIDRFNSFINNRK